MCIRSAVSADNLAKTLWFSPVCSIDIGDALGLYHAFMWINELQLANVDFEADLKKVSDYYLRGSMDITEFWAIIWACKHYCNLFFLKTLMSYIFIGK